MSTKIKAVRGEFEKQVKSMMEQAGLKSWDLSKGPTLFKVWGLAEESELLSISYGKRIVFNFVTETGQPFALDVGGLTAPQIKKLKGYLEKTLTEFAF